MDSIHSKEIQTLNRQKALKSFTLRLILVKLIQDKNRFTLFKNKIYC